MSTIPDNPVNATKPETFPTIPTTSDQRLAHTNINSAFAAAKTDVEALETGKEDAGTAASEVATHNASGAAHGGVQAAFGSHDGAGGAAHADVIAGGADGFMTGADKTKLDGVAVGANAYSHPNHTGDVTSVGDGAQTIANSAVTNAKLANMVAETIKLRQTTTGAPQDVRVDALPAGTPATGDAIFAQKSGGALVQFDPNDLGGGGGSGTLTTVRKNTGADISTGRARLNFIEGANVTIDIADDAVGDEADITITSTAAGGGGGDMLSPATMSVGELYSAADSSGVQTQATGILQGDLALLAGAQTFTEENVFERPAANTSLIISALSTNVPRFRLRRPDAVEGATSRQAFEFQHGASSTLMRFADQNGGASLNVVTINQTTTAGAAHFDIIGGQLREGGIQVVKAAAALGADNLTSGNGTNGVQDTSIAAADVVQASASIAATNLVSGISGKTVGDSGIPLADVAREGQNNTFTGVTNNFTGSLEVDGSEVYHPGNPPPGGGSGDVVGPASSVDNAVVLFDGVTGKLVKDSAVDFGDMARLSQANVFETTQTISVAAASAFSDVISGNASTSVRLFPGNGSVDQRRFNIEASAGAFTINPANDAGTNVAIGFEMDHNAGARFGLPTGGVPATLGHVNMVSALVNNVALDYPDDKVEAGTTANLALTGSPRVVCTTTSGTLTVNAPTSGEGSLEVIIESGTPTVTPTGFTAVRGDAPTGALRIAYVTRIASGSTVWAWGA